MFENIDTSTVKERAEWVVVPEGAIWLRRVNVLETPPATKEVTCWIRMRPVRCDTKTLTLNWKTLNKSYQNLNPKCPGKVDMLCLVQPPVLALKEMLKNDLISSVKEASISWFVAGWLWCMHCFTPFSRSKASVGQCVPPTIACVPGLHGKSEVILWPWVKKTLGTFDCCSLYQ